MFPMRYLDLFRLGEIYVSNVVSWFSVVLFSLCFVLRF